MPGLLRGVARTAVVAGTASAVSGRVRKRQYDKWSRQEEEQQARYAQQPPQPPVQQAPPSQAAPAAGESSTIAQLKELAELKAQGILTEEEFAAQKAKILG